MKLLLLILSVLAPAHAKESSLRLFRFVEASSVQQKSALPPRLEIVLDVFCNEQLVQVIRHDTIAPETGKTTIAVGAIVKENLLSSCAGEKRKLTVDAGETFSGRDFEIVRIKQ